MEPVAETRRRLALLVATSAYSDPDLRQLRAPGHDATELAEVLRDPRIGEFDVQVLLNLMSGEVQEGIEEFCTDRRPDDQLMIYLSCHGVLDSYGRLYYATANTRRHRLAATAVAAAWLNERLEDCRARSQILVLDCCHSGAFAKNAKGDSGLALQRRFKPHGRGRVVLTASRSTEYSFEGGQASGEGVPSVFTHAIVKGLRTGDADRDKDGLITVTDLYQYVYESVRAAEPRQTPELWTYGAEGNLLIAYSVRGAVIEPEPLPEDLRMTLESPRRRIRETAVAELADLLDAAGPGLALAARQALERMAEEDHPQVAELARIAVDAPAGTAAGRLRREIIERSRRIEEAERQAREKAERQARERTERQAQEEAERQAQEEAEHQARERTERQAQEEAERQAQEEAERQAQEEAQRQAQEEAQRQAQEEAQRQARERTERQAQEEAQRLAREEAQRLAREEAQRLAREEAQRLAREEAQRLAREEAERQARERAERLVREEAERLVQEEAVGHPLERRARTGEGKLPRRLVRIADQVNAIEEDFEHLSDAELRAVTGEFRQRYADGESLDDLLPEAFATVREAAKRTLGQRPFDVQIMGGAAMHLGNIAEMKDGEGKTLASVLPAYLNALIGQGVHVVTVNDYLAKRDFEWVGRIHRFLGLEVGIILAQMTPKERRKAYEADITYGTNNEFGFDYLRDNMAWGLDECVQRGHNFAIVDEVDSILVDEARTPLIISGPAEQSARWYTEFAKIAPRLRRGADGEGDYEVDEKKRTVGILESGVEKVEDWLGLENLYDPVNTPLVSFLNNALKAKELYKKDKDYVVVNGEVLIVDEFTGRMLHGRRYNGGMHQAIEAKEGVQIQNENQTLATITLQNYFRLYDKLAGMTGTAMTEANEFHQIYKLGVVPIPTNVPMIRDDQPDVVYQTAAAKFEAVVEDIKERHEAGQPVLVGTTSVEKSEILSRMLKRRGVPHEVLNANYYEREAAIVAQAGRKNAVTVATNMVGRGTNIMLGGNPAFVADAELRQRGLSPVDTPEDYEAAWPEAVDKARRAMVAERQEVVASGGLYVLGTERHESQRIDSQLRGRSGRRGNPGESRFYLSLEDDLMRMFNADKVAHFMEWLKTPPDVPIESKAVTRSIRSAQTQVEQQNFEIRKDVLKYDDVLNRQRKVIYGERRQVLEGADLYEQVRQMIDEVIMAYVAGATCEGFPEEWDLDQLWTAFRHLYHPALTVGDLIEEAGGDRSGLSREFITETIQADAHAAYDRREAELTPWVMREFERRVVLSVLDRKWREHLSEMEHLREGIGLRVMTQRDPLIEYQREGFDMFNSMMEGIKEETVGYLFNLQVEVQENPVVEESAGGMPAALSGLGQVPGLGPQDGGVQDSGPRADGAGAGSASAGEEARGGAPGGGTARRGGGWRSGQLSYSPPTVDGEAQVERRTESPSSGDYYSKVGRNDPCPCGSGRLYKRCHGDPRNRPAG